MRISSSDISMAASSYSRTMETRTESLRLVVGEGNRPGAAGGVLSPGGGFFLAGGSTLGDRLDINTGLLSSLPQVTINVMEMDLSSIESVYEIPDELHKTAMLIEAMIEVLTGKKVTIFFPGRLQVQRSSGAVVSPGANQPRWGVEYNLRTTREEFQQVAFSAQGTVTLADGRQLSISFDMLMQREFFMEENFSMTIGEEARIDPLVLNLDGSTVSITSARFDFDLTSDGNMERIAFAGPGSGFLALDVNGDGIINDGSELFGPTTGNGFLELAAFDEDGNGWIDEGDSVYSRLLVWTRDAAGNDRLQSLSEAGVGAIYLGNARVAFDFKDQANRTVAEMRSAGIFLHENGVPGSIVQVDLVT